MQALEHLDSVRIASPKDVLRAAQAFQSFATSLFDCRVAACHNVAVRRMMHDADNNILATTVFGWTTRENDRWWRMPNLALAAPIPMACRYESEPFWCNADGFRAKRKNPWLDGIDLSNFEKLSFARVVIVVPVHLPFSQIGAVGFSPRDPDVTDLSAEYEKYGDLLGLYARAFISSYQSVMVTPERLPLAGKKLSKREVECLRWAAVGKTNSEIGEIMSRTRGTVRFHIQNATAKLNAVNRSQALFKAAQLGYIGLNG